MRILFTRSNSLLSRLIRKVTGEPVSHCALECSGWVIHSNLRGLHVELPQTFLRKSEIVYSVEIPYDMGLVMHALSKYEGKGYDIGALLYLGLRSLLPFLPKKNLWQSTGLFLCTEWVTQVLSGREDHMITPYGLYKRLSNSNSN
jgi:hypothetical protein